MEPTPLACGLAVGTCVGTCVVGTCVVGGVGVCEGDVVGDGDGALDASELCPEQVWKAGSQLTAVQLAHARELAKMHESTHWCSKQDA